MGIKDGNCADETVYDWEDYIDNEDRAEAGIQPIHRDRTVPQGRVVYVRCCG